MAFMQLVACRMGLALWQSPDFSGMYTGSPPLCTRHPQARPHKPRHSLSPGSGQRRRCKDVRGTADAPDAASRQATGCPQAISPGRPLARWQAWPPPRSVTCCRRGSFAGPPPAGTMKKPTYERHNSRRAWPGAALTARSSTAPGQAQGIVSCGPAGARDTRRRGRRTASAENFLAPRADMAGYAARAGG